MIVQDLQRTVLISSSKKMNNIMVKLCSVSNMCLAAKDFRIFVTDWFRRDMTCTRLSIVSRLFHQFVHAVRSRGERHHMDRIFEFGSLKTFISFLTICCCYQNEKKKNLVFGPFCHNFISKTFM